MFRNLIEGYYWQDEDWDRVWCAAYHYDYEGYPCYYGQDEGRCRDYHIYIDYCREQDNEHFQRFEIVHLGNNRIMIRIQGDWCWSDSGDYVEWQRCDYGNRRQQWIADVGASKFQIRSATKSSLCGTYCIFMWLVPAECYLMIAVASCFVLRTIV